MSKQFNAFTTEQAIDYVNNCSLEQLQEYKIYFENRKKMARKPSENALSASLQRIQDSIDARG